MHFRKRLGFVKRMTVDVPAELYKRLESRAREEGRSVNEVAYEKLENWLRGLPQKRESA